MGSYRPEFAKALLTGIRDEVGLGIAFEAVKMSAKLGPPLQERIDDHVLGVQKDGRSHPGKDLPNKPQPADIP